MWSEADGSLFIAMETRALLGTDVISNDVRLASTHDGSASSEGAMRLASAFLAVALLIAGCGDASPDELTEAQAARGLLDCPSDLVEYSTADVNVSS